MDLIISILAVLLVLGGLIFFHELGHHLAARSLGMGVSTFSLGFGPKLFSRKIGKTEYCLSLIPLGGYCALVGESDDEELPDDFTREEFFSDRPTWQRLIVIIAGPLTNILLALVICWGLAFGYGYTKLVPTIGGVQENSPAAVAGLTGGDTIVSIDGKAIDSWENMAMTINASQGKPMTIVIDRAGKQENYNITAKGTTRKNIFGEDVSNYIIGVKASGATEHVELGFWDSISAGAKQTWGMLELTWMGFVKLFQRVVPADQVGGPILIAQMIGQQATAGLDKILYLAALISINLGILNLLPIPVLDGGHIVFLLYEMIFRRPMPDAVRGISTRIGFALLIALMIFATYNDIMRLVKDFAS